MAGLIMRKGPSPGLRVSLTGKTVLGRHSKADVVVKDLAASRRHAAVLPRDEGFFLVDLGSTNGTFINGEPLKGEVTLRDGDLIRIGQEEFEFVNSEGTAGEPATATLETLPLVRSGAGKTVTTPMTPIPDLPRELGKYILLSHLGRGGMGDVYRARERDGSQDMAVKVIRSDIGARESFLDYFHNREAVFAREIDHPNVIRIFEHGAAGGQHYITMEYVEGESLLERLRRGPVPFDEALEILRQVSCGLVAAHRMGVVHSDIKPGNIMILKNPTIPDSGLEKQNTLIDQDEVVLEFPDRVDKEEADPYDGGLRDEIRRRLGDQSQDLLLDPPYLQRASEMHFLSHYWENLKDSRGVLLLVEGEAGSGKDRLLSEFIKDLGLVGSVSATFVTPQARLRELDASRFEGIPQLYQQIFPERAPPERPSREVVEEILVAMTRGEEPVVLRVLNLDDASPLACELLEGLVKVLAEHPVLVLATMDPTGNPRNAPLKQLLSSDRAWIKRLYLRPLTSYQISRYLQNLFREPVRDDRLAFDLHRLTGGNFTRLLDMVRDFLHRGLLKLDRPAGRVIYQPSPREFELAEGKQFYEKYRSMGKMEQRVVEHAAFIGPEFLFDTLLSFSEIDETALFFIVRELYNQGFFTEPSRTWYRFTNLAFRRYIADRVRPRERPRLHRKVAWLLDEAPMGVTPELLRLRAYHWEEAGEPGRAVRLLLEGAYLARTEFEVDLARQMYQEILRIYRSLSGHTSDRRAVTDELRAWFHRDANWYEVLGGLGEEAPRVQVKITDFGISFKIQDDNEFWIEERLPLGTPRYLAPERVRREPGGPKADIFALGIITYEILTGLSPFPRKKGQEVMNLNVQREIPTPVIPGGGNVPDEFYDLYRGMVEKDEELRWDAQKVLRTIAKLQMDSKMNGV